MINRFGLLLLAAILFCPLAAICAPESVPVDSITESPRPEPLAEPAKVVTNDPKPAAVLHDLHRLDFRMEGKSCPVCLLSIQNKLKSLNGVLDAAVMLKRPWGVSVVYAPEKADSDYIFSALKAKEPAIKIFDVKDSKIDKMPVPLIPPFVPELGPKQPVQDMNKPVSNQL